MNRKKIFNLLKSDVPLDAVLVKGWVRTLRTSKAFSFLEINDGSCLKNVQVIADEALPNYADIKQLTTGSAVIVNGKYRTAQYFTGTQEKLLEVLDMLVEKERNARNDS